MFAFSIAGRVGSKMVYAKAILLESFRSEMSKRDSNLSSKFKPNSARSGMLVIGTSFLFCSVSFFGAQSTFSVLTALVVVSLWK